MRKKKSVETVADHPVIEVAVRVEGEEVCIVAFFPRPGGGWDIICGLNDPSARGGLCSALNAAAQALHETSFDERSTANSETMGDAPF